MSEKGNHGGENVCHRCGEVIKKKEFIRVGTFKFHKEHFTCFVCNELLHGKKFHHKDGKFYCSKDYTAKFSKTCRHCKKPIQGGSVIQAFGGFYHPNHFVCAACEKPFKNGKYFESNNKPYCEEHFLALTADKCEACKKPVVDDDVVRVRGKVFHSACLSCYHCHMSLARNGSIFWKDQNVYCREDYLNLFCKRCTACGDHILKHCISVNDESYHPSCLKCSMCGKKLDKYICTNGHLRCAEHAEAQSPPLRCSICGKLIDGGEMPVLAVGKTLHANCCVCQFCNRKMDKSECKLRDGKLCCSHCMQTSDEPKVRKPIRQPIRSSSLTPVKKPTKQSGENTFDASLSSTRPKRATSTQLPDSRPDIGIPDEDRAEPEERRQSSKDELKVELKGERNGGKKLSEKNDRSSIKKVSAKKSKNKKSHRRVESHNRGARIEWRKGELIDRGSFGKVYQGMNTATGELIAVKQMKINADEERDEAKTIENEIELMRKLTHPNIVQLLGTETKGSKLYILMEYVPGSSVHAQLEKFGPYPEMIIRRYARQLLSALDYCHSEHVVHRDIKGKNILVMTNGTLKLADFGSAKIFEHVMSNEQASVGYNYTPLWTAPEVLVGDYNSLVDIWSLGCVMIEMATGKPPWSEENFANPFRALFYIGNSGKIPKIPESLSSEAHGFIKKCLTRNPADRPTAAQLMDHAWFIGLDEDLYKPDYQDSDTDDSD